MLFCMLNMFCTFTLALSEVISCFPSILPRYCLNDFEVVPVAPIIVGVTFAFTLHMF